MNKLIGLPFTGALVPKVLDGSKSQTRRIPGIHNCRLFEGNKDVTGRMRGLDWDSVILGYRDRSGVLFAPPYPLSDSKAESFMVWHPEFHKHYELVPRHEPGDIAWMREKHYFTIFGEVPSIQYAAGNVLMEDANEYASKMTDEEFDRTFAKGDGRWRPGIHMPRLASRKEMVLTGVRIELIQDISEEDARAEGVTWTEPSMHDPCGLPAIVTFERLWDSINASRNWSWRLNRPIVVFDWSEK